jgi:hypothetical protein
MKVKRYRYLCFMNEGFSQAQRSLKALAKHSPLERSEIRRFEQLAAEAAPPPTFFYWRRWAPRKPTWQDACSYDERRESARKRRDREPRSSGEHSRLPSSGEHGWRREY